MTDTPPVLQGDPGWGPRKGLHGQMQVPLNATDTEIRALILQRVAEEKLPVHHGRVSFEKFSNDGVDHTIAFEVI